MVHRAAGATGAKLQGPGPLEAASKSERGDPARERQMPRGWKGAARLCRLGCRWEVDTGEPADVRNKELRWKMRDEKQSEDGDVHLGVHMA